MVAASDKGDLIAQLNVVPDDDGGRAIQEAARVDEHVIAERKIKRFLYLQTAANKAISAYLGAVPAEQGNSRFPAGSIVEQQKRKQVEKTLANEEKLPPYHPVDRVKSLKHCCDVILLQIDAIGNDSYLRYSDPICKRRIACFNPVMIGQEASSAEITSLLTFRL